MTIKNNQFSVLGFCGKAVLILTAYAFALILAGFAGWYGGEILHDILH